jgi:hypothetical protein
MSNDAELPKRIEVKSLNGFAVSLRVNVARQSPRFTQGKLRRRWARLSGCAVRHHRTIADCPYAFVTGNGERLINHYRAALVTLDGQSLQQRVRRCSSRPDERFACNLFAGTQHDNAVSRVF